MSIRNRMLTGRKTSNWIKTDDLQVTVPLYQLSNSNSPWEAFGAAGLGLRTLPGEDHCIHNHSELATSKADCHLWSWVPVRFLPGSPIRVSGSIAGQGSAMLGAVQFWKQNDPANWLPELSPMCLVSSGWALGLHEMPMQNWLPFSCGWADLLPKRFHSTPSTPTPELCLRDLCECLGTGRVVERRVGGKAPWSSVPAWLCLGWCWGDFLA